MVAEDRIRAEIARLDVILKNRGGWFDDEQVQYKAFSDALQWLEDDRKEAERIEAEAQAAAELEADEARRNDPNAKTRKLFEGVKIKIPRKD